MNLLQFKRRIETIYNRIVEEGKNPERASVVITSSESAIGGRAFVTVEDVNAGFDWESNQVRIEPKRSMVRKEQALATPMKWKIVDEDFGCGKCESRLRKTFNHCPNCGQRINWG